MHAARPCLHESGCKGRRGVAGAAVRAEAAPSRDRTATLTVEFHSVSTGPGLGCPHPDRCPRSIVAPPLTNGIHSVWRRRGSSDSHPNRRARLIVCRHSPSEFTAFRVVAERSIPPPELDALVRARSVAHHRNSQGLGSSRSGLFTLELAPSFERVPSLTIEIHSVSSRREAGCPHPNRHRCSSAADAHRRNSQRLESLRSELSTPESASSFERVPSLIVEIHRVRSVRGRRYPHPYRPSRSTAQRLAPRPDGHVDILQPNRLTTLCIRKVRATIAAAKQGCGGVDISCRHRLVALWISMVSVGIRLSCGPIEVWTSGN